MVAGYGWILSAACAGIEPETFFPGSGFKNTAASALAVCARCPVKPQCLDYAVSNGMKYGIWGGMGPDQRKQYRKRNSTVSRTDSTGITEHGTEKGARQHYRLNERPCRACADASNLMRSLRKRKGKPSRSMRESR